jgi:peroxiredoxin Q/BCP
MNITPLNVAATFLLSIAMATVQADGVDRGSTAPNFHLLDQNSKRHTLSDYSGRWLVLYFYPKDDTPGCTTQACEFRDDIFILKQMGVAVVGVSLDDVGSHREFAEKYSLPFPLLSDAEGEVASRYGALTSFGPVKFAKRQTFIIAPDGTIAKVYRNVRPKEHSDEVIADLRLLTTAG